MPSIEDGRLKEIKQLYQNGLSMQQIADKFNVSLDAVVYYLRHHKIPRRSRREANNIVFNLKPPSFYVKKNRSLKEEKLFISGLSLYWAEGSKWHGETTVDFANSDPSMIKLFIRFLREICGIEESKLRVYLYCHSNQPTKKLTNYWSCVTRIPKKQFTKPYIKKNSSHIKSNKMKHGLVHIRYYDKKLLLFLLESINKLQIHLGR